MKRNPGKILLIIGCIMVGLFICGFFNGGAGLIEAAFHATGTPKILGIIYILVGAIGVILALIGFFLNPPDSSSSKPSSASTASSTGERSVSYDDDVTPIESHWPYEDRTLTGQFGNSVDVSYNTLTGKATDSAGREYTTSDGEKFYLVDSDENDDDSCEDYYE